MRTWWVNQNQTAAQEIGGGYLWSPQRKRDGSINPYYEFMREVAPGDLVLSFADTRIAHFGIARSHAYEAPKPAEFGAAGRAWDDIGWRVDVDFSELARPIRPAQHMDRLAPLLPSKYSPLSPAGRGSQSIYLTRISPALALALAELIGEPVLGLLRATPPAGVAEAPRPGPTPEVLLWEEHLRGRIEGSAELNETEKLSLVLSRRGQGLFRDRVAELEPACRITGVRHPDYLRASHIKPWRDADNDERLDGHNGLLLTPSVDHLFDRGFISFRDNGELLVSPVAHGDSLRRLGIEPKSERNVGKFAREQRSYLEYHRDRVFLQARVRGEN